jgi:glutathione S-transferase
VAKGCDNNQYDHTSILRYLTDKYDLRPLNERTRAAGGFGEQLLGSPREDTLPPFKTLQPTRRGKQAADKLDAPIPPDNTRRVLLALGERLHAQERLARHGAAVPDAAAQLPITTPTDPHAFQQRMANVDRWLAERPRAGSAQIHIPKPVVVLDHMPAADAEPIVVPPSVADGERPHE